MERKNDVCVDCLKIACKECDWVATEEEVVQIQNGCLSACPKCGWRPR